MHKENWSYSEELLLISDPFSEESMLGISSMLGILFRSPNVVFCVCGATLQLYGFKGRSLVVSSLPGILNKGFNNNFVSLLDAFMNVSQCCTFIDWSKNYRVQDW